MAIVCVSFVESFFGECIMVIKKVLTEINTVRTFLHLLLCIGMHTDITINTSSRKSHEEVSIKGL